MLPFLVLMAVPFLYQHIGTHQFNYEKKNRTAITIFFVLLTVLLMFRHKTVGIDTSSYLTFFTRYARATWTSLFGMSTEFGFTYLCKVISLISREPQTLLIVTAILGVAMIYPTYRRLSIDPTLTIVLFTSMATFAMSFSGIRQTLAIGLGVLAYECTRRRKLVLFILVVALAITFHNSAFVLLLMYPIYHARITKNWLLLVVPLMGFVFLFNEQIFGFMSMLLMRFTDYDVTMSATGAYASLFLFALFAVYAYLVPDESWMDEEAIGLRNLLLLSLALQMFAPLHTLAMRMNYYFIIFIPLLMPKIVYYRSERWAQVAVVGRHIMVIFFFLYFFMNASPPVANLHMIPYHFFWETVL